MVQLKVNNNSPDNLTEDYRERVYAGVLGKLIGVYLGRPFEGWSHERILEELGEITYYVNDRFDMPLVLTDDDVSGTFTFLRALEDHSEAQEITSKEIGETWLNYLIEMKTVLWWGGNGNSTEHTAFLNLKRGIEAPASGSIETNGRLVAEQIGAQIFIDGWAMVAPGNPKLAAALAAEAARVSHDGEAVYAAQLLAAMEAQAFIESDIDRLFDTGLALIPRNSLVRQLVDDVRRWHKEDNDWYKTRERIADLYGYHRYGGNCHVIPNHAIVVLSLLYGQDDFQQAMLIANTAGWDTDCNAGNVGCLLGIKNGLVGLERGPDWRSPLADRLYLSTADGGRAISDAVLETQEIVRLGYAVAGREMPTLPKNGARFHFELPGSLQGWQPDTAAQTAALRLENVAGHSEAGTRSLALCFSGVSSHMPARASTPTFIPPEAIVMPGNYEFLACPTLYAGQTVEAKVKAAANNSASVEARIFVRTYDGDDKPQLHVSEGLSLDPGMTTTLNWTLPDLHSQPIFEVGIELTSSERVAGTVYLDYLKWCGMPELNFSRPEGVGKLWQRAWVHAVDHVGQRWPEAFHVSQNRGRGLVMQGTQQWKNYRVTSTLRSEVAHTIGICSYVQGLERYYALVLAPNGTAHLIKRFYKDLILATAPFHWVRGKDYTLELEIVDKTIRGHVDGCELFTVEDEAALQGGGIGFLVEEGLLLSDTIKVQPV